MSGRQFVCPFCPLHCDDLDVDSLTADCSRLARQMAAVPHTATDANKSPLLQAESIRTARQWVTDASTIGVAGHAVDLETARAVCQFVDQTGAILNIGGVHSDGYSEAFARDGMIATTLGDATSSYQQIVMLGDPSEVWPRLRTRLAGAGSIYSWQHTDDLLDRMAQLRWALKSPSLHRCLSDPDLTATIRICQQGPAVVFVVVPGAVTQAQSRPFWSTMTGLLLDLNRRIRATLLRFDDAMTLRSVAAWTSDGPRPVDVFRQHPLDLEIRLHPWDDLGRRDDVTHAKTSARPALIQPAPRRRIIIGSHASVRDSPASQPWSAVDQLTPETLHLDAAIPGISRAGIVIRGDGSVSLPLGEICKSTLFSFAETLRQLTQN